MRWQILKEVNVDYEDSRKNIRDENKLSLIFFSLVYDSVVSVFSINPTRRSSIFSFLPIIRITLL